MSMMHCDRCGGLYDTDYEPFNEVKGEVLCENCLEITTDEIYKLGSVRKVHNCISKLLTAKGVSFQELGKTDFVIAKKMSNGAVLKYVLQLECDFYDCVTRLRLAGLYRVENINNGFVEKNPNNGRYTIVKNVRYRVALDNFKSNCISINKSKKYRYTNNYNIEKHADSNAILYNHVLEVDILNGDTKEINEDILVEVIKNLKI